MCGMNRIVLAVFACLFAMSLSAQTVDLPYNPDSNADQIIGAPDLLDFLPTFGEPFVVGELMVDGMTLEQYLSELSDGVTMVGVELLSDTVLTFTFSNDSVIAIPFPEAIIGPQGPPGPQGDTGDDGADGATGEIGADGLSAYQIWLGLGNSGSEQDFIDNIIANFYAGAIVGCADSTSCTYNSEATIHLTELCGYFDACGICVGGANGDGDIYDCGCSDIPEGDCDCDGNQLDALDNCGGGCQADVDADGICDNVDPCVGDYDACDVCNGPGDIYDCGCSDIPEGDCDCGGVQLDALGECDGNCQADVDDDGICDDVDPCVGQLDALGECGGNCAADANDNGICDSEEISGCIISNACNYNPVATEDDGSCIFYCPGCPDEAACNYDADAIQDDGSCEYPVDLYGVDYLDCFGECLSDEDGDGICLENEVYGCTDSGACNYDPQATEAGVPPCEYVSCVGCMYEFACNYDPDATVADNGSCEFGTCPGCTHIVACNYNPTVTEDDGSCDFTCLPWLQLGEDIDGEAEGDQSGTSVSLSADGSTVAIGTPNNDGVNGNASGHVRLYHWNGAAWEQLGEDIDGEAEGDWSGYRVSLSSDGSTVAIGAYGNGGYSGHVRVYQWYGSAWDQLGEDIDGEAVWDQSGVSVSLSADGTVVAIGAPSNDGNGNASGHVRLYQWSGNAWNQLGEDIDGEAAYDQSGKGVSLSADGSTVAIGAPSNDGNGTDSGHVRLYQWNGAAWTQLGEDIDGEAEGDVSGSRVSLSADGTVVAIGAPSNDGNGTDSGRVRLYQWNGAAWNQLGEDIDGEAADDWSGVSVSLSADGSIVAIGADWNDGNGSKSGHVRLYQWSGNAWNQLGEDIDGEAAYDQSGASVSLSADGSVVAIGAIYNGGVNGDNSGHVRVFSQY